MVKGIDGTMVAIFGLLILVAIVTNMQTVQETINNYVGQSPVAQSNITDIDTLPSGSESDTTTPPVNITNSTTPAPLILEDPTWSVSYFNNPNLLGVPITTQTIVFPAYPATFSTSSPAAGVNTIQWSARFVRNISFEKGFYKFWTKSDDGARVFIDGTLLYSAWNNQSAWQTFSGFTDLSKGVHLVTLEYFNYGGSHELQFNYSLISPIPMEASLSATQYIDGIRAKYPNKLLPQCTFPSLNKWGWLSGMNGSNTPQLLSENGFNYVRLFGESNLSKKQWQEMWTGFGTGTYQNASVDAHPGDTIIIAAKVRTSEGATNPEFPWHKGAFVVVDIRPLNANGTLWGNETSNRRLTQVMEVGAPSFMTNDTWVYHLFKFTIPYVICDPINASYVSTDDGKVVEFNPGACSGRVAGEKGQPMYPALDLVFDWSIWGYNSTRTADIADCYLAIVPKGG